jgi:superfamily II DNA/RNA helicase
MCLLENLVKGMYQYGNSYYVVPLEMPFFYWENISESPIALTLYYHEILFKGLEKPSAVQQRGIVSLGMGLDVIQQSLSGTTMTICFGVLQRLDYGSAECQALVLVPTRDIAQETEKVIQSLGQYLGVKTHVCTGGYSAHTEQRILSSRVQVLIGTPGRVLDVLQRRALCPDHIAMFVLDEANELLTGRSKGQVNFFTRLSAHCGHYSE